MREKEVPLPPAIARTWAPASTLIATVGSMAADSTHSVGEDELPKLQTQENNIRSPKTQSVFTL